MKTYVVMMARDLLTGEPDIRCRSDIETHSSFKRINDFVTYRKDDKKIVYTVMYEGSEEVCKKFKENLLKLYATSDFEMYGGAFI